jgi:hypothetical protein
MKTYAGVRAFAAAAAVAFARFPVDAQDIASNPNARAIVVATETTRSLNEFEGLTESSLTQSVAVKPSRSARLSARRSGVKPAPRSTLGTSGPPGRSDS